MLARRQLRLLRRVALFDLRRRGFLGRVDEMLVLLRMGKRPELLLLAPDRALSRGNLTIVPASVPRPQPAVVSTLPRQLLLGVEQVAVPAAFGEVALGIALRDVSLFRRAVVVVDPAPLLYFGLALVLLHELVQL